MSQSWGGEASCAEANEPRVVQEDEQLDNEVILQAKSMISRKVVFKNVADRHWIRAQKDDPVLHYIWDWLTQPKGDKQTLSGYLNGQVPDADWLAYSCQQKDLVLRRELMYMETNAPGTKDRILTFLVPANKCHAALDGCHRAAGHQGRDRTLSLLREILVAWDGCASNPVCDKL